PPRNHDGPIDVVATLDELEPQLGGLPARAAHGLPDGEIAAPFDLEVAQPRLHLDPQGRLPEHRTVDADVRARRQRLHPQLGRTEILTPLRRSIAVRNLVEARDRVRELLRLLSDRRHRLVVRTNFARGLLARGELPREIVEAHRDRVVVRERPDGGYDDESRLARFGHAVDARRIGAAPPWCARSDQAVGFALERFEHTFVDAFPHLGIELPLDDDRQ